MKNKKTLLLLVLLFVLLLGGAGLLYRLLGQSVEAKQLSTQPARQEEPDETDDAEQTAQKIEAPDFIVYDAQGNEVRLSDYFGKPIVLNFWASWCGPCQSEMPDFHEKYLQLGEDIHFLMVNMTDGSRETIESAAAFISENEYTFPVLYDTQSSAALTYGAYSLPTTFFIDAEGYAVAQATGAIDADTLQRGIDMITELDKR